MTGASGLRSQGTTFQLFAKVLPTGGVAPIDDLEARFAELKPIRQPHATQKSKHMPGKWFSSISGRHVQYDSRLERSCLLQLEFEGGFVGIVEQPFRLKVEIDGSSSSHVPDFLLKTEVGGLVLVDVKPARKLLLPKVEQQFSYTRDFCGQAGIAYRVMSEPDVQLLSNLEWLHGFRDIALDRSIEFARMWTSLAAGPLSISRLLLGAEQECLARPVLFAALWRRLFETDLLQPFNPETEVRRIDVS